MGAGKLETVQSILTVIVTDKNLAEFKKKLVNPLNHELAFITSLQSSEAGRWLTVVPRSDEFRFHNAGYEAQLRYRLHLPVKLLVGGTVCDGCKKKVVLDKTGEHLVSGCRCFGKRTHMHNGVASTLSTIISYCGFQNIREELSCFKEADPDNGKRPDISVLSAPFAQDLVVEADGRIPKLILDVQVTNVLKGTQDGVLEFMTSYMASKPNNMANKAFAGKMSKYKRIATDNGLSFLPIIFETTGRIHPRAVKFLESLAEHAAVVKGIKYSIVFGFIMNKLSCMFQKLIAETLNSRVNAINGRLTHAASKQFTFSHDFVVTHERFRSRELQRHG